ncbi:MAG: soluble lytic murein transglycosylase Slt [Rhodobacteraceae bacterium HLUCCA12]|nr:MAG: soluble lytic murein transglycosylase Slt [Rhodobacteraceae bacterium HLUCCA12]
MRTHRTVPLAALAAAVILASPAHRADASETPPPPRAAGATGALIAAFAAGDVDRITRLQPMAGQLGMRIALWHHLRNGRSERLADYVAFDRALPHWPLADTLRRQAEATLDDAEPEAVIDWFTRHDPMTDDGAMALFSALEASGAHERARALARDLWRDHILSTEQENRLLARFDDALSDLHAERLDALLWRGATDAADRMLDRVSSGHAALGRARLALQARENGVNALINAVPSALADDPGLAHDRFQWRMHRDLLDEAGQLMLERSEPTERLGRPQAWASGRQRLARRALQDGEYRLGYALASSHGLDGGAQMADLEWLAGYFALRHLNEPEAAQHHFARLRSRVSSPISLARAGYWEGRAFEAMGQDADARAAYEFAAEHQTAFYGQLAAERAGIELDSALLQQPDYPHWRQTSLARSDLLQAALLMHRAGDWHDARRFVLHLAQSLSSKDELGALAQLWLDRGEPNFAVNIGKIAVQSGIVLPGAYFPLTGLESVNLPAPAALVMAIARRESEFDPAVISHADARGLLQVLPGTGALMAERLGIDFDARRLTTDPAFNAMLGAAYLDQLIDEFGALSLVAAGYNAGPGRPRRWITEFGDPRDPSVDPIDWIERIPFSETRNYVMRVLESYVLYRAMLNDDPGPVALSALLRGD